MNRLFVCMTRDGSGEKLDSLVIISATDATSAKNLASKFLRQSIWETNPLPGMDVDPTPGSRIVFSVMHGVCE